MNGIATEWVLLLNEYLKTKRENLHWQISQNERSFEIWNREKFLLKEEGKKVLKRCGLDVEKLNFYQTAEPLAYYSHTRKTPKNMLILENKDTFYSMRRHLLEGKKSILGVTIGTLIYGAGKGIFKSFQDFEFCVEPYMKEKKNQIFYFGDCWITRELEFTRDWLGCMDRHGKFILLPRAICLC